MPSIVDNIVQENADNIAINLKTANSNVWLQLCWEKSAARIGLGQMLLLV